MPLKVKEKDFFYLRADGPAKGLLREGIPRKPRARRAGQPVKQHFKMALTSLACHDNDDNVKKQILILKA